MYTTYVSILSCVPPMCPSFQVCHLVLASDLRVGVTIKAADGQELKIMTIRKRKASELVERRTDTDVLPECLCVRLNVAGGEAEHEGVSVSRPAEKVALKMKMLAAQKAHD